MRFVGLVGGAAVGFVGFWLASFVIKSLLVPLLGIALIGAGAYAGYQFARHKPEP